MLKRGLDIVGYVAIVLLVMTIFGIILFYESKEGFSIVAPKIQLQEKHLSKNKEVTIEDIIEDKNLLEEMKEKIKQMSREQKRLADGTSSFVIKLALRR